MSLAFYSIKISQTIDEEPVFSGYFSVGTNNLVTSFYQTNNGTTDFSTNILVEPGNYDDYSFSNSLFSPSGVVINVSDVVVSNENITQINLLYTLVDMIPYQPQVEEFLIFRITGYNTFPGGDYRYFTTEISDPSCFNEGTKILCLNKNLDEEYILIENLRKGDLVKTYKHGYRKIDLIGKNPMINNPEKINECMYKMEKTEITGGHSILVDDLNDCKEENDKIFGITPMIDDKYLLLSAVSKEFIKMEKTELYTYYHFILENNENDDERFGVWANGILTETPSKTQFTNHKYTLL